MRNVIFQYYIPYEGNDAHIGGVKLPDWAAAGQRSAKNYAESVKAEYLFLTDRWFPELDPRLDSLRIFYDPQFEQYDNVLVLDLDMLIRTRLNVFSLAKGDVSMVHETGVHNSQGGFMRRVMDSPLEERGIIAYGKKLFGKDWMFPKSSKYPNERFRYMNGGLQVWSKEGRLKAREHFTSIHDYVVHTRYTEQMYVNLQLSQPVFQVHELDTMWNRVPYQWIFGQPDGYINHFYGPTHKKSMPLMERML